MQVHAVTNGQLDRFSEGKNPTVTDMSLLYAHIKQRPF